MKLPVSNLRNHALSLVGLLVIILSLLIVAAIVLPMLAKGRHGGGHINCANNVKQIALSYRVWANDHNGKFPMEVSVANGGTMELAATGDVVATFQVMSNELSTPRILICPLFAEQRGYSANIFATNFSTDLKTRISYFIGLDARTNSPSTFLCGDDNLLLNDLPVNHGLVNVASKALLAWDSGRHFSVTKQAWFIKNKMPYGNICLADGSVQQPDNSSLANRLHQTSLATNRLAIP